MNGEERTFPWVYVGIGCTAIVVLGLAALAAMGFLGYRWAKQVASDVKDPATREAKVKEVLGSDRLPEGYHPMVSLSLPTPGVRRGPAGSPAARSAGCSFGAGLESREDLKEPSLVIAFILAAAVAAPQAPEAEVRVVEYLKANVKPGQPVVVSELYNDVFTSPEDRAVLNRLFNTFFKMPLYMAQHLKAAGKPPTLREISEQFHFEVPGEADVMLRIMESDPRMPRFITRDAATGEITSVDVDRILAHPRFGKALERTITGWEGRPAPAFATTMYDGKPLTSESLAGTPHLVYFWFSGCPPCVRTAPILTEIDRAYAPKGFRIVALNADRALELPYTDEDRAAHADRNGWSFTLAHMTPAVQEAYGAVSVFPTLFFVDRDGTVVRHFVNFQQKASLEEATRVALQ